MSAFLGFLTMLELLLYFLSPLLELISLHISWVPLTFCALTDDWARQQGILKVPRLGKALAFAFNLFNRYVLSEDYAITRTQQPRKASLNIGEHFIPGDRPIALYLRHWRDLILAAEGRQGAEKETQAEKDVMDEASD